MKKEYRDDLIKRCHARILFNLQNLSLAEAHSVLELAGQSLQIAETAALMDASFQAENLLDNDMIQLLKNSIQ